MPEDAAATGDGSRRPRRSAAPPHKEAGDEVHVRAPNGERLYEVLKLTTIHGGDDE